jgi:hypothetical protein
VKVFEQAPAFSRIGAGIILSANATKVLRRRASADGAARPYRGDGSSRVKHQEKHRKSDLLLNSYCLLLR